MWAKQPVNDIFRPVFYPLDHWNQCVNNFINQFINEFNFGNTLVPRGELTQQSRNCDFLEIFWNEVRKMIFEIKKNLDIRSFA